MKTPRCQIHLVEFTMSAPAPASGTPAQGVAGIYLQKCRELGITPNSSLVASFSEAQPPERFDFHQNYIGDRGVLALCEVFKTVPRVVAVSLKDNGIRNAGVIALVDALKKHPMLVSLDISSNQISATGGLALLDLLKACPNLVEMEFFNNRIDANTRLKIKHALDENKARH